jgi:hypothetical protein
MCAVEGFFVSKLGKSVIAHILEVGKGHFFSISYCPLCFTSCACKLLESIGETDVGYQLRLPCPWKCRANDRQHLMVLPLILRCPATQCDDLTSHIGRCEYSVFLVRSAQLQDVFCHTE